MATLEQRIKMDYANYCKDGQIQTQEVRDCIRKNGADIDDAGAARLLVQIAGPERRMSEQKFADGIKNFILFGWEAPQQQGQYSQYNPQLSQSQYNPQQPPNQYNPQLSQSQYNPQQPPSQYNPQPPPGQYNPQGPRFPPQPPPYPGQYNPQNQRPPYLQQSGQQQPPYLQQSQQQPSYLQQSQQQPPYPPQPGQPPYPPQPGQPGQPGQPPYPPQPGQPGQPGQPPYPPQSGQPGQPPFPPQPGYPPQPGQPPYPQGPPLVADPGATSPHPQIAARLNDFYRQAAADGRIDANEVIGACQLYNIRLDMNTAASLLAIVAQPDRRVTQEKFVYHIGIYCTKYLR